MKLYLFASLCLTISFFAFAQELKVSSVTAELRDDGIVEIKYQLSGDFNRDCIIELFIIDANRPAWRQQIESAHGAVGEGAFIGEPKTILWDMNTAQFELDEGAAYQFEVSATYLESGGGWVWYVLGGAAVAGGAAAAVLLGGDSGGDTPTDPGAGTTDETVPLPPPRGR